MNTWVINEAVLLVSQGNHCGKLANGITFYIPLKKYACALVSILSKKIPI